MTIGGRKVQMFRTVEPPLIGPKPMLAHVPKDLGWDATFLESEAGIHIKTKEGQEHVIFTPNLVAIRLEPSNVQELKRGPGRPKGEAV